MSLAGAPVLYTRFRTKSKFYVYDTYSNNILETEERLWHTLPRILQALDGRQSQGETAATVCVDADLTTVRQAISAGYLRPCSIEAMAFYSSATTLTERVTHHLPQLSLELTQSCNQRCRYCAYTYDVARTDHPRHMSLQTARNAVEVYLAHSAKAASRCVSFWGGEPLLRFETLRNVVKLVQSETAGAANAPFFQFTTNGTLIDHDVACFLAANRIRLLVSLDGPKLLHDRYRRTVSGHGTYDAVMRGLNHLWQVDPAHYRENVRFNCVIGNQSSVADILAFFSVHELLRECHVEYSLTARVGGPFDDECAGLSDEQRCNIRGHYVRLADSTERTSDPLARLLRKRFRKLVVRHKRPVEPVLFPNGCCVPLLKKMHVAVDGGIYLCEQSPHTNCVGNVNERRLDVCRLLSLAERYVTRTLQDCKRCWAVRLCSCCYQSVMRNGQWDPALRESACHSMRDTLTYLLEDYASILEECPEAFDGWQDVGVILPI